LKNPRPPTALCSPSLPLSSAGNKLLLFRDKLLVGARRLVGWIV
jgi:hypothetical protein